MKWTVEDINKYREMYMEGATYQQLAFEFGVSVAAAAEVRRRNGIPPWKDFRKKKPPVDLAAVIERVGVTGARDHYSVGWNTLRRWTLECGIKVDRSKRYTVRVPELVIPEDWSTVAPTLFKGELARHYRISGKTVNRIIEVTGVHAKRIVAKPKPEPKPKPPRRNWRQASWGRFNNGGSHSELQTMATEAARFLRRLYPNVHRCDIQMREGSATTWGDEHGVPNRGKGFYRVGPKTMTEFEMVNLALARGMDA